MLDAVCTHVTSSALSRDSVCGRVYVYACVFICICMYMFVKLYFCTSDIHLISLVSLDPSGFHLRTKYMSSIENEPIYELYCISCRQYQRSLNILFVSGAVSSVDVWCCARRSCQGRGNLQHLSAQLIHYIPLYIYIE